MNDYMYDTPIPVRWFRIQGRGLLSFVRVVRGVCDKAGKRTRNLIGMRFRKIQSYCGRNKLKLLKSSTKKAG